MIKCLCQVEIEDGGYHAKDWLLIILFLFLADTLDWLLIILFLFLADTLDWILRGLFNNDTKCPCSDHKCETKKSGYVMAVALVRKLRIDKE